jgi:AcrR family transcriptional regulator
MRDDTPGRLTSAPDQSRERILEAAETLLRRFGPEKFRIVDVAEALGMSHGNIYRYFPHRQAILDAIAQRWLTKIIGPLQKIARKQTDAEQRLEEWILTLIRLKRRKVIADPELFRTYHAVAEAARTVVQEHVGHLCGQLADILRSGTERGEWKVRKPRKAAETILRATLAFHHPYFVAGPGPQPSEANARDLTKLLVAGLKSGWER